MNVVYETSTGNPVSFGTVVADPLPAGLTSLVLTQIEWDGIRDGTKRWDPATLTVIDTPPDPAEIQKAADIVALKAPAAATPIKEEVELLNRLVAGLLDGSI